MADKGRHAVKLVLGDSKAARLAAARQLAMEAGTKLGHIDLKRVVGKYIGETEKNLAQVFDRAQARGWILFFDEADALFGKRAGVKDSHDRYANLEVGYLLSRLESFGGLVLLASNRRDNLDTAFLRRLRVAAR
ncbi:MAG: ATP-binding protein [Thiobacillus sp.]|nr:ATP-binding protein [Thiobacillus sp.]